MKKFLQKKLKNEKGMTLIELLAVIVIIAIIAAIAIPAIGNIIENSRVGAVKSDALNALAAADLYFADNPQITAGTVDLAALKAGYLDDAGSLTAASVTEAGLITGAGTVSGVTVDFGSADKKAINGTPNNTANGVTVETATHKGLGTVKVTR